MRRRITTTGISPSIPDTDNVYVFTSTISASVTRADIPTHANFIPLVNVLSDAEAVDDTSHVYGSVSGSQLADAIAAHGSGGGGAITQATEATLGGVRGASRPFKRFHLAARIFSAGRSTDWGSLYPWHSPP